MKQANYIAKTWKLCFQAIIDFEDVESYDRNSDGTIHWTTEEFPDNIITKMKMTVKHTNLMNQAIVMRKRTITENYVAIFFTVCKS